MLKDSHHVHYLLGFETISLNIWFLLHNWNVSSRRGGEGQGEESDEDDEELHVLADV